MAGSNPMYGQNGAGTAASGGKGGSMGGFDTMGGGKGGAQASAMPSPTAPPQAPPAGPGGAFNNLMGSGLGGPVETGSSAPAGQGPNAFETGLNAQNDAMAFFQSQMNNGQNSMNQQYTDMITGMINNMSSGAGQAGNHYAGGGMNQYSVDNIARGTYDYDASLVDSQGYQAAQLSDKDIGQYMDPYLDEVMAGTMGDLDKARKQALNSTGVAATSGGAFGGDRHGVMESMDNANYLDQVARSSAQLRSQGFQNAQAAAMGDVNAMNQQYGSNAAMAQQSAMANAAAQNERGQFMGSTANANANAKQQLEAQMAAMGSGGGTDGGASDRRNAAANQQAALQAAMQMQGMFMDNNITRQGMQNSAANNVYQMGQDRWGMAQNATDALGQAGAQVDNINQGLANSIQDVWNQQVNAGQNQFNQYLAALAGAPQGDSTSTSTKNPGFFDYASLGAGAAGSFFGGK